jgi:hypothetical protein
MKRAEKAEVYISSQGAYYQYNQNGNEVSEWDDEIKEWVLLPEYEDYRVICTHFQSPIKRNL